MDLGHMGFVLIKMVDSFSVIMMRKRSNRMMLRPWLGCGILLQGKTTAL